MLPRKCLGPWRSERLSMSESEKYVVFESDGGRFGMVSEMQAGL